MIIRTVELLTPFKKAAILDKNEYDKEKEMIRSRLTFCKRCGEVGHSPESCREKQTFGLFYAFAMGIRKAVGKKPCPICNKPIDRFAIEAVQHIIIKGKLVGTKKAHIECVLKQAEITRDNLIGHMQGYRSMTQERNRMKARERYRRLHPKKALDK